MSAHLNTTSRCIGLLGDRDRTYREASAEPTFAGVVVGGTRIKVGLADKSGRLLSCRILEAHDCRDPESFLKTVADEITSQALAGGSQSTPSASAARARSTSHRARWFG